MSNPDLKAARELLMLARAILPLGQFSSGVLKDVRTLDGHIRDFMEAPAPTEAAAMAATVPASPHRPSPEWYAAMIQSTVDDDFQIGPAFVAAPKDHEIAALVNRVRDVAIEFHGAQQLRVRIAEIIVPALKAMRAPVAGQPAEPSPAARDVLAERARQISVEGWDTARDDRYIDCELAAAAASYALCDKDPGVLQVVGVRVWPWPLHWWKPTTYRRNLVKAGALILAEIERIDRRDAPKGDSNG